MERLQRVVMVLAILLSASCTLWSASGSHIHNTNAGNIGVGTANPASKLTVLDDATTPMPTQVAAVSATISSPTNARAVYGAATNANSTSNYGGHFTAAGESSGVFGEASDPERGVAGGVFHTHGKSGKAVIGFAINAEADATGMGGWFSSRAPNGVGLYAEGGPNGSAAEFNGVIHNRAGGIRFPDGTVQTTAGPLVPRGAITVRERTVNLGAGSLVETSVPCAADEVVMGGGFRTTDDPKINLWKSMPVSTTAWGIGISNYSTVDRSVTLYAVCMRVQ